MSDQDVSTDIIIEEEPKGTNPWLIVLIVVLVIFSCCCIGILIFYFLIGDAILQIFKDITYQLGVY